VSIDLHRAVIRNGARLKSLILLSMSIQSSDIAIKAHCSSARSIPCSVELSWRTNFLGTFWAWTWAGGITIAGVVAIILGDDVNFLT
jgi:hypothetical protein